MTVPSLPAWALDVARVLELHKIMLQHYGGAADAAAKLPCVESSIGSAYTATMYRSDTEPDPLHYAAFLFGYLNKNHCFTDGNKRVAWASLVDSLLIQGLTIKCTQQEAIDFVLAHAAGTGPQVEDVVDWLSSRLVEITVE